MKTITREELRDFARTLGEAPIDCGNPSTSLAARYCRTRFGWEDALEWFTHVYRFHWRAAQWEAQALLPHDYGESFWECGILPANQIADSLDQMIAEDQE